MSDKPEKREAWPEIDLLECKGCGRCVLACPTHVLEIGDDLNPRSYRYVKYKGEGCIGCANCFYTCPEPYVFKIHIPLKNSPGSKESE